MRIKINKALAVVLSVAMLCCLMTGCSRNDKATLKMLSITSATLAAKIESVSNKTLNITIGALGSGGMGGAPNMPAMGGNANMQGQTPPDKPDDSSSSGDGQENQMSPPEGQNNGSSEDPSSNTPPDNTQGNAPDMPGMPQAQGGNQGQSFTSMGVSATLVIRDKSILYSELDGDRASASLEDFKEGSFIQIEVDDSSSITAIVLINASESAGNGNNGFGSLSGVTSYDSVKSYSEDATVEGESITSTGTDENAVLVTDGATVLFRDLVLSRTSEDSKGGDNASFYGVGSALLVINGTAYIKGGTVETDAAGGAGIFAYDKGQVYIAGATISTSKDTSGGIHVAGGGTLYAWDLTVTTEGNSAAAIRSDRGGGTMVVNGGSYTSNGTGSPAVYCTAEIAINNAKLTANNSEAICIEGLNSLYLFDTDLVGTMKDDSQNDTTWTIIVYQSMSGDSEVGNSTFQMVGGTLTSKNGGLLYTTNTESHILMSKVDITESDDSEFFLQCTGNNNQRGWGASGSNGADCTFTAILQEMKGDVIWDSISQLDFYMIDGSSLTGAFKDDESFASNGSSGYANVYISSDSSWIVTGNSTVSSLYSAGKITDQKGNLVTIKGTDGTTYVQGNSSYTVTVSSYSSTVDLSGADSAASFPAYEVDMPSQLN